jgi:dipeptide/tripeptide permease
MTVIATHLVARWAQLYSDDRAVSSVVTYLHLAGVLLGGGVAVAADRATIAADRTDGAAVAWPVHRWVVAGLVVIVVSGVLMMLSDLHTYVTSPVFWTKMGLTLLLLGNGYVRLQAETAVSRGVAAAWRRLRSTSIASLVLWFAILLAGTILGSS